MKKVAVAVCAMLVSLGLGRAALAEDAPYAFKVENVSGAAVVVVMDGKQVCALSPAGTCNVFIKDGDPHSYAFSVAGGAAISFQPGNPEMVEVCKLDAKAAHCLDPTGAATN